MTIFKSILSFLANEILHLRLFISPLSGKRVSKRKFLEETKYLNDVNFMFATIEDVIFSNENLNESDAYIDDFKYFELINKINSDGEKSLSNEEHLWLQSYCEKQDKNWKC